MSHVIPATQYVVLAIGALVPLVTYVLNHYAPWADEKVKTVVLVVVAAVAGGLYQALEVGDLGLNAKTLSYVLSAVFAAALAHNWIYRPGTINTALGGGTNKV